MVNKKTYVRMFSKLNYIKANRNKDKIYLKFI